MTRYQISYLIKGEAKAYLENLSNVIAEAYRLTPVIRSIDPHLTLKAPFEADSIFEVEDMLSNFSERAKPEPLSLGGFGRFENRVIFMDAQVPDDTCTLIERIQDQLAGLSWMSFRPYERPTKLHATLCYPRTGEQATAILSKLIEKGGRSFDLTFDNVAILSRGPRRWEVEREFEIKA